MSDSRSGAEIVLVTGGARGIGRAVCELFATQGATRIYVNYAHSSEKAQELAGALRARGVTGVPVCADISDPEQVANMMRLVENDAGRLDVLVNNAGVTKLHPFRDIDGLTAEMWQQVWETNLLGTFWCCRSAAPLLRRRRGCIVNVASIAGTRAVGSSIPYGVTKAAIMQLTRSLALALAPDVRVNSVSAGTVISDWHVRLTGEEAFSRKIEAEAPVVPLQRVADPADIAEGILALANARYVTGQDLLIDGGKGLLY